MHKPLVAWKFIFGNALILFSGLSLTVGHVLAPLMGGGVRPILFFSVFLAAGLAGLLLLALSAVDIARISRRLSLLADMSVEINRALLLNEDMEYIYDTILEYLFRIFPHVGQGTVLVLDENNELSCAASRGYSAAYAAAFKLPLERSFLFVESGGNIDGARLISRKTLERQVRLPEQGVWRYQSVISAPLYAGGRLYGQLNLDSPRARVFVAEDVRIVERFTAQIEVCLLVRGLYRSRIESSRTDALTGLYTRRYFEELFGIELARAERYGESFTLALFDADGLKRTNDGIGHQAGDLMLKAIADALREGRRKTDFVGRYGGDEYIALYHTSDTESMERALEETRERLGAASLSYAGTSFTASFCFGAAKYPDDGKTLDELTAAADRRLYEMKKRRR